MKTKFTILIIFSCLYVGILQSQWERCDTVSRICSFLTYDNKIFTGYNGNGLYYSTNSGLNWVPTSLSDRYVYSIVAQGYNIFTGTEYYGVYLSTNNGLEWNQTSLNTETVYSLGINGDKIFAGIWDELLLSTNNGINWSPSLYQTSFGIVIRGNNIYSLADKGIYLSTNSGANWEPFAFISKTISAFEIRNSNMYAGANFDGVYISTDAGLNWTQTTLNNQTIFTFYISDSNIFAGTLEAGIYYSSNNGTNWVTRNEGLPSSITVVACCVFNNYMFIGSRQHGLWRRHLSELIGIKPVSNEVPSCFRLYQNYPNPFNLTTKMKFAIPPLSNSVGEGQGVRLSIYDILGREVATLVNEKLNAGTYEIEFDGTNFTSGIYFYKLSSGDFNQTRKMVLVK